MGALPEGVSWIAAAGHSELHIIFCDSMLRAVSIFTYHHRFTSADALIAQSACRLGTIHSMLQHPSG
jgi:hypothetical protein